MTALLRLWGWDSAFLLQFMAESGAADNTFYIPYDQIAVPTVVLNVLSVS